jgi:hypothetical protein
MKKILISFATNPKWYRAQAYLNESAKKFKLNGVISYTDKSKDWEFVKKYDDIVNKTRGYGYWQWKSIILLDAMNQVNENDMIIYVDSGNIIINSLDYIFDVCQQQDIVLFENRDGNYQGRAHRQDEWTKRDCFVLMGCDEEKYYYAPQCEGSYQIYKKTDKVMSFLKEYNEYSSNENIISDLPNITKENLPQFIDHRHDQSIISNMAVKYDIPLLPEPSEWGNYLTNRPYPQLFWHHRGVF